MCLEVEAKTRAGSDSNAAAWFASRKDRTARGIEGGEQRSEADKVKAEKHAKHDLAQPIEHIIRRRTKECLLLGCYHYPVTSSAYMPHSNHGVFGFVLL